MIFKKAGIMIWITIGCLPFLQSQDITKPNYALKSHETLEITRVESTPSHTTLYMSVENKINEGYFCADKNIFIIYPDGTRSKLISSKGIPVCPDSHKFKAVGEKLSFELTFPSLKPYIQWIDLLEDCPDNCFSFYGVCLNKSLNKKIDEATYLAENNEQAKALIGFTDLADSLGKENTGMTGLIYMSIIKLAKETGNAAKAAEWYSKLKSSNIPGRDLYIKNLNSIGITY